MTQAINLANFANNLNTSGQVDPNALSAATPITKGGTGATTAADARTALNVPTRTGTDASGNWPIGITGNAATVTNGVYTSGSQVINGSKQFNDTVLLGNNGFKFASDGAQDTGLYWIADGRIGVLVNGNYVGEFNVSGWEGLIPTTRVLNATASATAGMVGTYAFMSYVGNTAIATDTLVAGSNLRYRAAQSYAVVQGIYINAYEGGAASGTWRLMGHVDSVYEYYGLNANNNGVSSLWLRVA